MVRCTPKSTTGLVGALVLAAAFLIAEREANPRALSECDCISHAPRPVRSAGRRWAKKETARSTKRPKRKLHTVGLEPTSTNTLELESSSLDHSDKYAQQKVDLALCLSTSARWRCKIMLFEVSRGANHGTAPPAPRSPAARLLGLAGAARSGDRGCLHGGARPPHRAPSRPPRPRSFLFSPPACKFLAKSSCQDAHAPSLRH